MELIGHIKYFKDYGPLKVGNTDSKDQPLSK